MFRVIQLTLGFSFLFFLDDSYHEFLNHFSFTFIHFLIDISLCWPALFSVGDKGAARHVG